MSELHSKISEDLHSKLVVVNDLKSKNVEGL